MDYVSNVIQVQAVTLKNWNLFLNTEANVGLILLFLWMWKEEVDLFCFSNYKVIGV